MVKFSFIKAKYASAPDSATGDVAVCVPLGSATPRAGPSQRHIRAPLPLPAVRACAPTPSTAGERHLSESRGRRFAAEHLAPGFLKANTLVFPMQLSVRTASIFPNQRHIMASAPFTDYFWTASLGVWTVILIHCFSSLSSISLVTAF